MFSYNNHFNKMINRIHLSFRGSRTVDGKFDWKNAVLDAAIISGINLFTGLGTLAAVDNVALNALCVLVAAVSAEFLGVIAAKRGLNISKNSNASNSI
jgi:hypothetical protein